MHERELDVLGACVGRAAVVSPHRLSICVADEQSAFIRSVVGWMVHWSIDRCLPAACAITGSEPHTDGCGSHPNPIQCIDRLAAAGLTDPWIDLDSTPQGQGRARRHRHHHHPTAARKAGTMNGEGAGSGSRKEEEQQENGGGGPKAGA